MCGIAGLIVKKGDTNAVKDTIHSMTNAVEHRGPDGEGSYCFQNVGLGHRRLAIIDRSSDGQQPMPYRNDQLVITYNGEIYNYLELREELELLGYPFHSNTDTEVILAAYAAWGDACVTRFNGMWAFAILDKTRHTIFCSRDRYGVKPFYYLDTPEVFAFGSEIRQLLPFLKRVTANHDVLKDFILTAVADHGQNTFFNDVVKLPAGNSLIYSLEKNRFTINRYYQITYHSHFANMSST